MAKKKFVRSSLRNKVNSAVGFIWPKLHTGKQIYVDFYVFDPASGEKKRIKKYFDNIRKKRERDAAISHYMTQISRRLMEGWNPYAETSNKGLSTIESIFERYSQSLNQYSRKKTRQSYESKLTILKMYISELAFPPVYAYQLTKSFYIDFLDWLSDDREVSGRTRNNYKGWLTSFCEWMVQRNYYSENPAKDIPKVEESEKIRESLTASELRQLFSYLRENDKPFLLACLFEYYTMIRPTELSHLLIGDIDIKNQCIYIKGKFSKNRRDGAVGLNKNLIKLMLELNTFSYPGDCYLFGAGYQVF